MLFMNFVEANVRSFPVLKSKRQVFFDFGRKKMVRRLNRRHIGKKNTAIESPATKMHKYARRLSRQMKNA